MSQTPSAPNLRDLARRKPYLPTSEKTAMSSTEENLSTASSETPRPEPPAESEKKGSRVRLTSSVKELVRPPFSDDIFISYSRADGVTYATGLTTRLTAKMFACRFDQWDTTPGGEIPKKLRKALRRSALLVLVGTPGA